MAKVKKDYDWIRKAVDEAEEAGEPLFLVRGQDFFSLRALREYIDEFEKFGPPDHEMSMSLMDLFEAFRVWQNDHRLEVKYPD